MTLEYRTVFVYFVTETRIEDLSGFRYLNSPYQDKEASGFILWVSRSRCAAPHCLAVVGIALSPWAELALLDWITVDSRLCAVQLNRTVRTRKDRDTRRCLFVISAYSPTNCSSDHVKDEFCGKISGLLQNVRRCDVVIVAHDFNAQLAELSEMERHLGGSDGVMTQRTDNHIWCLISRKI